MYQDMFGNTRVRLGLHHHTIVSDGRCTPEEVARRYREAGYDAIAITDHWVYAQETVLEGLPTIAGCEYDFGGNDCANGVYHILCLFAEREPNLQRGATAQEILDGIHEAGGLAVLAHPAWSLNSPEKIKVLKGIDATEIYNTVSEKGMSRRADSSLIVDMLAGDGVLFPLFSSDDSHYYGNGNEDDCCTAFIMVRSDSLDPKELKQAILEQRFYASTGPEVHIRRDGNTVHLDCSPVSEIVFFSNISWSPRVTLGEGLTAADYTIRPGETFLRAQVTDAEGRRAWTNCIAL